MSHGCGQEVLGQVPSCSTSHLVNMSVGPVGPGGGIYSITEDSLCQVYLLETFTHETFTHRRHLPIASI